MLDLICNLHLNYAQRSSYLAVYNNTNLSFVLRCLLANLLLHLWPLEAISLQQQQGLEPALEALLERERESVLEALLVQHQEDAYRELVAVLESDRYATLMSAWAERLEQPVAATAAPNATLRHRGVGRPHAAE